jgi:hypothetical protein
MIHRSLTVGFHHPGLSEALTRQIQEALRGSSDSLEPEYELGQRQNGPLDAVDQIPGGFYGVITCEKEPVTGRRPIIQA